MQLFLFWNSWLDHFTACRGLQLETYRLRFISKYFFLQINCFKQRLEPRLVDPQSLNIDIYMDDMKYSTLEEMQKFINKCLDGTYVDPSDSESSDSESSGSESSDSESSGSDSDSD